MPMRVRAMPCHCLSVLYNAITSPRFSFPLRLSAMLFRCSSFRRPATPARLNALPLSSLTLLRYDMPRHNIASPRLATATLRCSCRCHDFDVLFIAMPLHCRSALIRHDAYRYLSMPSRCVSILHPSAANLIQSGPIHCFVSHIYTMPPLRHAGHVSASPLPLIAILCRCYAFLNLAIPPRCHSELCQTIPPHCAAKPNYSVANHCNTSPLL